MSDHYVHRLSDRWHPGATLCSFASSLANSDGDPDDDWVDRFEIAKASLRSLHFTAPTGAR